MVVNPYSSHCMGRLRLKGKHIYGGMKMKRYQRHIALFLALILFFGSFSAIEGNSLEIPGMHKAVTVAKAATFAQKNALTKAKAYLAYSAFSKKGLKKQLKFEGFSNKEAAYAVNHCRANWKKQAVKKAKEYLKFSAFSKKQLYQQLIFEGFTKAQAKYGVNKAYK